MARIVALILARGGSKAVPRKNIIDFCGKPLLAWSIEQARGVPEIHSVWVSSDDEEILAVAEQYGARVVKRPPELATDTASSESGWLHLLNVVEKELGPVEIVVALQATSPLREPGDIVRGLQDFREGGYDSLLSVCPVEGLFFWEKDSTGKLRSVNYDYRHRPRRQDTRPQYLENGSFYIFKPEILRRYGNRLGGKIGLTEMEFWKLFEIDTPEDVRLCEVVMREYLL